jgi:hypothetical protein
MVIRPVLRRRAPTPPSLDPGYEFCGALNLPSTLSVAARATTWADAHAFCAAQPSPTGRMVR